MKTLIHKRTQEKEAKIIVYQGIIYEHIIIFEKTTGHYEVINKLKRHFPINDVTTRAGWITNGRLEFFSKRMVNERIEIANKKEGIK